MNIPACWATSRTFKLTGRPIIASKKKNSKCPPSSTGMGKKLIMARVMLIIAIKKDKLAIPLLWLIIYRKNSLRKRAPG